MLRIADTIAPHFGAVVVAAFFVFASALAGQQKTQGPPHLPGTWKMDASRSESAHQDVPIGPVVLVIQQTAETIRIETRREKSRSSVKSVERLTFRLDGTESINEGTAGIPIKAKAHWNGVQLVAETEREINGATVTTMQVFELGSNGREITIEKTLTVQHGYQSLGPESVTGRGKDVFVKSKTSGGHGLPGT